MGNISPLLFIGLLTLLCGAYKVFQKKGRPGQFILWGALFDGGLALTGYALGGAGAAGGTLMILYHGIARITAWTALSGMVAAPVSSTDDAIRGMIWRRPIHAILFAFALVATLDVSPTQTPDGIHLVFHAIGNNGGPVLTILIALANCVIIWRTAETISATCFVSRDETTAQPSELLSDKPHRLLIGLVAAILLIGVFRGFVQNFGIFITGLAHADVPHLEQDWTWGAWVLMIASFVLPCKRLVPVGLQGPGAVAAMVLAFVLVCVGELSPLGRFFGLVVTLIGTVVACYSIGYIENNPRKPWYWFFILITFATVLGIVTTQNTGQLNSYWEMMGWGSFFLIAWECTPKARSAASLYAVLCGGTALVSAAGLFALGGNLNEYSQVFDAITGVDANVVRGALFLTLIGFAAKAGLIPLHQWLPAAHPEAPSSVSAPLSGILTKMGVFGIIIGYYVLVGSSNLNALGMVAGMSIPGFLLVCLGLMTMAYGELMALREEDLKRMLAYSTMGQVGEIFTVLGIGTWLATAGALTHVLNHAIMKDLLFLCAGALIMRVGSRKLSDLAGLVRRMPWTVGCMSIGIISIMGLPPFNGFISKYIMIVACMDAGQPALAAAILIASLIGAIYYMRILRTILLDPEPYWRPQISEAPLSMRISTGLLAALCVLLGVVPQLGLSIVTPAADFLSLAGRMNHEVLPHLGASWPIYVIVPIVGALVPLWFRHDRIRAVWGSTIVLILTTGLVLLFGHRLDTLSFIMALAIPAMGAVNLAYAASYMEHSHTQWRFYAFFLLMTGGLLGVAASTDLFSFFLFWEIMSSWTLYFAISHEGTPEAMREGFKYFLFNVAGAAVLFLGVGIIAAYAGTAAFDRIAAALLVMPSAWATAVIALLALGFCMKAAQVSLRIDWQMHPALAPTPVSGYISSVLLKIAVFGLIKLFLVFGGPALLVSGVRSIGDSPFSLFHQDTIMYIVAWIGAFTLLYSAMQALVQTRLKRVFIWSTVSQIGYMVLGVGAGTALGMAGGLLHVLNHMFFKDLLFLMVGALMFRTHADTIAELGSIGRKMPLTMFCFFIGALAAIGVPPTNGFTSKWLIYQALMQQGEPMLALISLIGSVVTLCYFARFMHVVFLGQPVRNLDHIQEAPRIMLIPMFILVALTLLTGLFPGLLLFPVNAALVEFGMPSLSISLTGVTSGAGAWNATLVSVLMLVSFGGLALGLRRFLAHATIRETDGHACGHDPALEATRMPYGSVFAVFVRLCARLSIGERPLDENESRSN